MGLIWTITIQRDDIEGDRPQQVVHPQGEQRDLEGVAAEAADGLAR